MKYLSNAFSLNMLNTYIENYEVKIKKLRDIEKIYDSDVVSCIGHQDLANILNVQFNRASIMLNRGDILYVAQYIGERLPEGAKELPSGARIEFFEIEIF